MRLDDNEIFILTLLDTHHGIGLNLFLKVLRKKGVISAESSLTNLEAKGYVGTEQALDLIYLTPKGTKVI